MLIPNMIFSKPSHLYICCINVHQSKQISKIVWSTCFYRLSVVNMYSDLLECDIIKISHMYTFFLYISWKVNKFQNIRIDLLPATKCGKHVGWFPLWYFQNSYMYIFVVYIPWKVKHFKIVESTCFQGLSEVNKYADSEYDIFKTLTCIYLLYICHSKWTNFKNCLIDLLPATECGKQVCWFRIWYFQNPHICISVV